MPRSSWWRTNFSISWCWYSWLSVNITNWDNVKDDLVDSVGVVILICLTNRFYRGRKPDEMNVNCRSKYSKNRILGFVSEWVDSWWFSWVCMILSIGRLEIEVGIIDVFGGRSRNGFVCKKLTLTNILSAYRKEYSYGWV